MKPEILERFDKVMANLKPIEPSSSFDIEFQMRLDRALAERYEENQIERLVRITAERVRYVLQPKMLILVRVTAALFIILSFGFSVYFLQPTNPVLLSQSGIIMAKDAKALSLHEIGPEYKFRPGDIVSMEEGSVLDIALRGKYAVRVKDKAKFRIAALTPRLGRGKVVFELAEGKMLVSIEESFKGSSFIVNTETARAKALGTKFSIDTLEKKDKGEGSKTEIKVLEGKVEVKSNYEPGKYLAAKQTVIVKAGQRTEVSLGKLPITPHRLIEKEWRELEELYQIENKPRVILLIKNTPDRVRQLLKPCPIFISDDRPRQIPSLLEDALVKLEQAIKTEDKAKHLESIRILERIVDEYPNPKYNVQFLLYIGAYYEYIGMHDAAIATFKKVLSSYADSYMASIAQCAIGIVYEEKLHDLSKAEEAFKTVLKLYPNSLEAMWIEVKLGTKKAGKTG